MSMTARQMYLMRRTAEISQSKSVSVSSDYLPEGRDGVLCANVLVTSLFVTAITEAGEDEGRCSALENQLQEWDNTEMTIPSNAWEMEAFISGVAEPVLDAWSALSRRRPVDQRKNSVASSLRRSCENYQAAS